MSTDDFAENLRVLAGYAKSVSDICRSCGVNRTQFHRYLAGETLPSLRNLRRLCDYFGVEEHEILLDRKSFREVIRLRPPQLTQVADPFRDIQTRLFTGEPPGRIAMGYYHLIFCPEPASPIFYRAVMRLSEASGGIVIKLMERYKRPALTLPEVLKYEGTGFLRAGRLFSLMQEVRHRRSTWFTVLSVGDFAKPRVLHGTAVGSDPEGNAGILSFPVVWLWLGDKPDLRKAIGDCGYYLAAEIALPPEIENALIRH